MIVGAMERVLSDDLCARLMRDAKTWDNRPGAATDGPVTAALEREAAAHIAELEQQVEDLHIGRAKRFEELDAAEARCAELEGHIRAIMGFDAAIASAVAPPHDK